MAIAIRRGTTPMITATVQDNVDLSSIKTAWLYITQNNHLVIDKVTSDITISGKNISVPLSQEETLSLTSGVSAYIQIRLLTDRGIAYASQSEFVSVYDVYKDGVIV